MKYKPCCGMRCLLMGCKTQEEGGCYCVCRLVDHRNSLENQLAGFEYRVAGTNSTVYVPGRMVPPTALEREGILCDLEKVSARLKEYEINE